MKFRERPWWMFHSPIVLVTQLMNAYGLRMRNCFGLLPDARGLHSLRLTQLCVLFLLSQWDRSRHFHCWNGSYSPVAFRLTLSYQCIRMWCITSLKTTRIILDDHSANATQEQRIRQMAGRSRNSTFPVLLSGNILFDPCITVCSHGKTSLYKTKRVILSRLRKIFLLGLENIQGIRSHRRQSGTRMQTTFEVQ